MPFVLECPVIQVTAHMRVLLAVEPIDFRAGIDGLASICTHRLLADPFSGTLFVFGNRARTAIKILVYDGNGYWLCHKRLSSGRFALWSHGAGPTRSLQACELQVLLMAGDPSRSHTAPAWRPLSLAA